MKIKFFTVIILSFCLTSALAQSSKQIVEEVLSKSGSTALFKQFDEIIDSKIAEK